MGSLTAVAQGRRWRAAPSSPDILPQLIGMIGLSERHGLASQAAHRGSWLSVLLCRPLCCCVSVSQARDVSGDTAQWLKESRITI